MLKLAAAAVLAIAVAAVLVALTYRARSEGRLTHCRNNLRQIGVLSHQGFAQQWEQLEGGFRGRELLQFVREQYKDSRGRWMRGNPLNPFGCPVRGVQPADLSTLSDAEFASVMQDVKTIDYAGPGDLPLERPKEPIAWAADRPGNHPQGGYVLLVDFSQAKVEKALEVTSGWERATALKD